MLDLNSFSASHSLGLRP